MTKKARIVRKTPPPVPRPGTRKAKVFSAFRRWGPTAAKRSGANLELADATVRTWISAWKAHSLKPPQKTRSRQTN